MSVVCYKVEVSATSRSLAQRSPTDCGVSFVVCDIEKINLVNRKAQDQLRGLSRQKKECLVQTTALHSTVKDGRILNL